MKTLLYKDFSFLLIIITIMTEWDKMQNHQIYVDFDSDLFDRRVKAKKFD